MTARLVGKKDCRQGLLVEVRAGVAIVQGMTEVYECELEMTTVRDEDIWLPAVAGWVAVTRQKLGMATADPSPPDPAHG